MVKDVEFVRNAIFTEPADQSAWLYQRFVFDKLFSLQEKSTNFKAQMIQTELEYLQELIELEPDCKWPLVAKIYFLNAQQDGDRIQEKKEILERLIEIDRYRSGYYRDQI